MKKNIGTLDRIVRFVIGAACLVAIAFVTPLAAKIVLGAAGLFCLYEAIASWCLFYQLIGRTTCPVE